MNRWGILAILFTVRAVMGFQFQSIASVSTFLVDDLGIEFAEIGILVGLYLLPGIVLAYPSGALAKRFGDRRIVWVGLALMALGGVIVGLGQGYATVMIGRILCGSGAVLLNVLLAKMLIDWFAGREVIVAMAILVNSWPFGIALGLISQGWIAENWSWPIVQYVAAGLAMAGLLLMVTLYRVPPKAGADSPGAGKPTRLSPIEISLVSLAGLIWCLFNVALIVVISFAPNLLQANGIALGEAAILVSIGTWIGIATIPIGGYLAQRFQAPNLVMVVCLLAAVLAIVWISGSLWPLAPFILFGIFAWAPAGPIMALPAEVLRPDNRGPGMGVFFSWYYIGMGLLPAAAGWSYDISGDTAVPLYFAAGAMIICIPLLGAFRLLKARSQSSEYRQAT